MLDNRKHRDRLSYLDLRRLTRARSSGNVLPNSQALTVLITLAFLVPTAGFSQDQDEATMGLGDERFRLYLHAFNPTLDTQVRLDSANGLLGTTIDFEQNLGMADTETVPAAGFAWRFAKRHRLKFNYFTLDRSSASTTTTDIRFGDLVFEVDVPISSFLDTSVFSLGYSYSLLLSDRAEIGLLAGVSVQDLAFGIKSDRVAESVEETSALTAPLPSFGIAGTWALSDKWYLRAAASYFALELSLSDDEDLGGSLVNVEAGIEYRAFRNVSFELRYAYFDLSTQFTTDSRVTEVDYQYRGPKLGIVATF